MPSTLNEVHGQQCRLLLQLQFSAISTSLSSKLQWDRYLTENPKKERDGDKRKSDDGAKGPLSESPRLEFKTRTYSSDLPLVVVEQLLPGASKVTEVLTFRFHSDFCWRSSARCDFAIFKVPVPSTDIQLLPLKTSNVVHPTMSVHVFGFPRVLEEKKFDHYYAITPAQITDLGVSQMALSSLSAPGLSGSAIMCTKTGVAVGYLGGGFGGSPGNKQNRSYGFSFSEMSAELLLPDAEDEIK
ncbi:hypothetical protein V7S43_006133 [Phytophthora oleae]|uniref:Uncharacterized protein n=1 Tax=Phytophthora oleae TaxID=2107226 RepID=A0ABD3FQW5_9STRA